MPSLIQNIIDRLNHLPQSKLYEVLDFVEFLDWQKEHQRQLNVLSDESEIDDPEFEVLVEDLLSEITNSMGGRIPLLSDQAVSRAGIYEDHP